MSKPECPRESMRNLMAFSPRDWALSKRDAWLYGIVVGWDPEPEYADEDPMGCVANKHGWTDDDVARLRRLHRRFVEAFPG